jgi:general secretion pathway protein M
MAVVPTPADWPVGRRGRALALLLTLLVLAAAWMLIAQPVIDWHAGLTQAVENRGAVARRLEAVAETLPALRQQVEQVVAGAPPTVLIEGSTDALAGAALQARLRDFAARAQLELSSAETLPAEDAGSVRRIGVRISAVAPWPVLVRLLRDLDESTPRLLVDDVQLQAAVSLGGGPARPLNATLTVLAFRAATP